jgi:3-hydroxyisobutyrate dehydrogenase
MACVGNDDDLRSVCEGDGRRLRIGMGGDGLRRSHHRVGRGDASITRRCGGARRGFVDAPVSGGQAGAENGQLSIMCGGRRPIMTRPSR